MSYYCRPIFSTTFWVWLFKKNNYHIIFYKLRKLHGLVVFAAWDIWQHMHCNYLFVNLWHHRFLSISFLTWPKKSRQKVNILRTERNFKVKQKAFFIIFKRLSVVINLLKLESRSLRWFYKVYLYVVSKVDHNKRLFVFSPWKYFSTSTKSLDNFW